MSGEERIAFRRERARFGNVSVERNTMITARDNRFVYKVMHVAFSLSLVKIAVQDTDANGRYLHKKSYNTSSGAVYIT